MSVDHVEVLVEEPSMKAALEALLPKLLGDVSFGIRVFQGKPDLLAKLPARLTAYARSSIDGVRIVVIVDRDAEDCRRLKAKLEEMAERAGLRTRRAARLRGDCRAWVMLTLIAIEELESWYFGDWAAVRGAFPKVPATVPNQARFRDPDAIQGGTAEALGSVLARAGYFEGGLPKIQTARTIAPRMDPAVNRSRSFQVFRDALMEMMRA
ncbi:MAG: DUF4276 family protein [Anaeromyxobacter sp.]